MCPLCLPSSMLCIPRSKLSANLVQSSLHTSLKGRKDNERERIKPMFVWECIYSEARGGGEDPMAVYKACFEEHLAGVDELKRQVWGVGLGVEGSSERVVVVSIQ